MSTATLRLPAGALRREASAYRFVIEALLFAMYAAFGLSWIALTPLAGEIRTAFALTGVQFALLYTAVAVAKIVAPLLTALVAVRWGLKRTLIAGGLCCAAALLVPFAGGFAALLAVRFVFGLGGAVVVTLMSPLVMQWFPQGERALVTAFNNVAVNTGITVTLFATGPLAAALGWRQALIAYGLLSLVVAAAWIVFGRERADSEGSSPRGANQAGPFASSEPTARYRDVWARHETWLIALAFAGPLALYLTLDAFLPAYYIEAFKMPSGAATQLTGLFNLVGIPTAILAGILTSRLGLRRPFIIGSGIAMGFAALALLAPIPELRVLAAIVLGISLFAYVGPLFTLPMELAGFTSRHVGLLMGTVFSTAYAVSALAPVVVGALHDAFGSYLPGLVLWACFSWCLAIAGLLLPETGPAARSAR